MTEFSNIPFFVERAHYSTRVNQAFRNPSPLCANWQSPAEEFHNNFDDIYSAFFLYFLLSFSFLPFENETRSVGIIVTFVARRNSTTNGCEMEASIRGGSSNRRDYSTLSEDSFPKWWTHPNCRVFSTNELGLEKIDFPWKGLARRK